jgi:hypothetical protein
MEPVGHAVGQKVLDHTAAMHRSPIPDDDQRAGHLTEQVLQKGHDRHGIDGLILAVNIQLALLGDGTDRREVIPRPPLPQDGRMAYRGRGPDDTGPGRAARFVDEQDVWPLRLRHLWIAGQVSSRQRVIAASCRWRARRAGFWRLHRIAWHKRPTWTGWSETPHSKERIVAIRPRVHTWPRKPSASAPRCKSSGRRASWSADNRHTAPGGGRWERISGPPSRARCGHWLTAPSLPPTASAICRRDQPFWERGQACRRRASFQFWGNGFMRGRVAHVRPKL